MKQEELQKLAPECNETCAGCGSSKHWLATDVEEWNDEEDTRLWVFNCQNMISFEDDPNEKYKCDHATVIRTEKDFERFK